MAVCKKAIAKRGLCASIMFAVCLVLLVMNAMPAWAAPGDQTMSALTTGQPMQAAAATECKLAKTSSGSITWNASTNTVTMTNATIDLAKQARSIYAAIYVDGRDATNEKVITLNLVGNNTVLDENGNSYNRPIDINNASLRISGSGSLTIKGNSTETAIDVEGAFTAPTGKLAISNVSNGIRANGAVALNGAIVDVRDVKYYGIESEDRNVSLTAGTVTVANMDYGILGATGVTFGGAKVTVSNALAWAVRSSSAVTMNAGSLTMSGCNRGISASGAYTQAGGIVTANTTGYGVYVKSATIKGGTLKVNAGSDGLWSTDGATSISGNAIVTIKAANYGIWSSGSVTVSGGTVTLNDCKYGIYASGSYTQTGGTVSAMSNTSRGLYGKSITLRNGALTIRGGTAGVYSSSGATSISGGTLNISGCSDGISGYGNLSVSNGKITINGCKQGIFVYGTTTVSSGTVNVTNVDNYAIRSSKKLTISGGAVTAKCKTASKYAIYSYSEGISNKAACLKAVYGQIEGKGAIFVTNGSTYVVHERTGCVTLKSYGGSSKKPTLNTVKYGGFAYGVRAVESKAFSTKKGKAITALTLGNNMRDIKANAFYGTTKLTTINIKKYPYYMGTIAKTAFKKCGKSSGAKLTFKCASNYDRKHARKLLLKKGVSKKAKFK